MDKFSFDLSIAPDTAMTIKSSLGNMRAVDCTLPDDHPYHQACGLRPGSNASLVNITFASHPAAHAADEPRVPSSLGVDTYYTLEASLNELQLVFLYRFLQENLQYISTMLAMRLPHLDLVEQQNQQQGYAGYVGSPGSSPMILGSPTLSMLRRTREQQQQKPTVAQQAQQPFVLVLKVEMNAPVITMPRGTASSDAIHFDLGDLCLHSQVVTQPMSAVPTSLASSVSSQQLLIEATDLVFSGVGLTVIQGGEKGHNIVQNSEQGWKLKWKRPLVPDARGDAPKVSSCVF